MSIVKKETIQKPQDRQVDCDRFEHASSFWMDLIVRTYRDAGSSHIVDTMENADQMRGF
jgi:hypothetical protein